VGLLVALLLCVGCTPSAAPLPQVPVPSPTPAPPIAFPRDAGPHDALTEWWYYTGHLAAEDGRKYGFEFVVFQVERENAPTGYLAHFAISDIDAGQFSHWARFSEGQALSDFPLSVGDWTLGHDDSGDAIDAADSGYALRLRLSDEKPAAPHHGGYMDYGPAGGSYYYSRTRLQISGSLASPSGGSSRVAGIAWMDHQWGNFVVAGAGGWDWYSLQFDDQTELMLYVLRAAGGETTGVYGTRVLADGTDLELSPGSVTSEPIGSWTSPHTGPCIPLAGVSPCQTVRA
jgi:predicted secreted hydrolase